MKRWLCLMMGGLLGSGVAAAREGDTIQPYASLTMSYDSNLLRLADNETDQSFGAGERSDVATTLAAGLNVNLEFSRQVVKLALARSATRLDRFSRLDYDGQDLRLDWSWRVGNQVAGGVGASRVVTQTQVNDLLSVFVTGRQSTVNNLLTRDRLYANVEWSLHPRWRLAAGVTRLESSNDQLIQRSVDSEEDVADARVTYRTPKGSQLSAQIVRREVRYPFRSARVQINQYEQTEFNLLGDWAVAGKLTGQIQLGRIERSYDSRLASDFSGYSARASTSYVPTGKTALTASIYREVYGTELSNSSLRINNGLRFAGQWRATARMTLSVNGQFESQDYDSAPDRLGVVTARNDKLRVLGMSLGYEPLDLVTLNLGAQLGELDSAQSNRSYQYHSVFASVRADF